jgi:hypothetical protein
MSRCTTLLPHPGFANLATRRGTASADRGGPRRQHDHYRRAALGVGRFGAIRRLGARCDRGLGQLEVERYPGRPWSAAIPHQGARARVAAHAQAATPPLRRERNGTCDGLEAPRPRLTPEPAKSVPTAAQPRRQWDRLRLELLTDDLDLEAIEAARDDPAVPTEAELRGQAKALGLPVPPPRRHPDYTAVRAQARREMLTLFEQTDGR